MLKIKTIISPKQYHTIFNFINKITQEHSQLSLKAFVINTSFNWTIFAWLIFFQASINGAYFVIVSRKPITSKT